MWPRLFYAYFETFPRVQAVCSAFTSGDYYDDAEILQIKGPLRTFKTPQTHTLLYHGGRMIVLNKNLKARKRAAHRAIQLYGAAPSVMGHNIYRYPFFHKSIQRDRCATSKLFLH